MKINTLFHENCNGKPPLFPSFFESRLPPGNRTSPHAPSVFALALLQTALLDRPNAAASCGASARLPACTFAAAMHRSEVGEMRVLVQHAHQCVVRAVCVVHQGLFGVQ